MIVEFFNINISIIVCNIGLYLFAMMMYRKVASYLSKTFQDPGKQKEAASVNLSQVSQGRTRKESARLFYEILVCLICVLE
jgi:hypothetical protein